MAKAPKVIYVCRECGNESAKWFGRCPACGEWNTLEEQTALPEPAAKAPPRRIAVTQAVPIDQIQTPSSTA